MRQRFLTSGLVSEWFGQRLDGGVLIPSKQAHPARVVQSKTAASAAPGATITATFDATPTVGNLMVCAVNSTTYATAGPSGFTLRNSRTGQQGVYIYTRVVQGGDGAGVTWDPNGDYTTVMSILEIEGVTDFEDTNSNSFTESTGGQTSRAILPTSAAGPAAYLILAANGVTSGSPSSAFTCPDAYKVTEASAGFASHATFLTCGRGVFASTVAWTTGATNTYGLAISLTAKY